MKKRYTIFAIIWPIFIVSLVLALPLSDDNAVMVPGPQKSSQETSEARVQDNPTALSGPFAPSDSRRLPDSAIVAMLLFATGVVGLVGISRKKGSG